MYVYFGVLSHFLCKGRVVSNALQWALILYAVTSDPTPVVSATVCVALGTVIFYVSMVDLLITYARRRED